MYVQSSQATTQVGLFADAHTLQERTIEHQASGIDGNRPITIGQGYSTIAWIPEDALSWALPLRHERITSWENPIKKAVWQLQQVCKYLPSRPISLWDSEYGCAPFILKTASIPADKLIRLRSNLCLWTSPPPYCGKCRPRLHGDKFKLNDSTTWTTAIESVELEHPTLGQLRISLWKDLHFQASPHQPMQLIRVERIDQLYSWKMPKPLWLIWIGEQMPPLTEIWQLYLRRFGVDHWYRLAKQCLHWTLPSLSTPKQCERWSDLMPMITWSLWLAREIVTDRPLQKQKSLTKLTPGRVAQAMPGVLAAIGTPACSPKLRGKSPGWPTGQERSPRTRYPIVKKGFSRTKKNSKI